MAKKNREHESVVESDSDSSDNSAKETGSEDSDSDSGPEQATPVAAKKRSAAKPQSQPPSTSSESGPDFESDSEVPNSKDSPISTQAKDQPNKSTNVGRKSRSKPSAADPATPAKSAAQKRPADEKDADDKASKKHRKKAEAETSEKKSTDTPKKSIIHRVWSEDDEIAILQGIIDHSSKKEADPAADENDYLDIILKNLSRKDSEKRKLQDKVRKLKKKYENNKIKEKDGEEMTFSKPHERKVYELSKSAWGNKNVKENDMSLKKAANKKRTVVADKEEAAKGDKAVAAAAVDAETESVLANRVKSTVEERVFTVGSKKFENGKGDAGAKEWKRLLLEEMQANLSFFEVKAAQARLVVDCLKSEGT